MRVKYDEAMQSLIDRARSLEISEEDDVEQRRSFAFGNAAFENPMITREMINEEDEKQAAVNG